MMINSFREVALEEGSNLAQSLQMSFFEVSAKEGTNVELLFKKMVSTLMIPFQKKVEDNNMKSKL